MAQAQVALPANTRPSRLWIRLREAVAEARARRADRKALIRLLSGLDTGIASGARV